MEFSDEELETILAGLYLYITKNVWDLEQDVYDLAYRIVDYLGDA